MSNSIRLNVYLDDLEDEIQVGEYINCCGVQELHGIMEYSPEICTAYMVNQHQHCKRPCILFYTAYSIGRRANAADAYTKWLRDHNFGNIIGPIKNKNLNSGNDLSSYMWSITNEQWSRLLKWYERVVWSEYDDEDDDDGLFIQGFGMSGVRYYAS